MASLLGSALASAATQSLVGAVASSAMTVPPPNVGTSELKSTQNAASSSGVLGLATAAPDVATAVTSVPGAAVCGLIDGTSKVIGRLKGLGRLFGNPEVAATSVTETTQVSNESITTMNAVVAANGGTKSTVAFVNSIAKKAEETGYTKLAVMPSALPVSTHKEVAKSLNHLGSAATFMLATPAAMAIKATDSMTVTHGKPGCAPESFINAAGISAATQVSKAHHATVGTSTVLTNHDMVTRATAFLKAFPNLDPGAAQYQFTAAEKSAKAIFRILKALNTSPTLTGSSTTSFPGTVLTSIPIGTTIPAYGSVAALPKLGPFLGLPASASPASGIMPDGTTSTTSLLQSFTNTTFNGPITIYTGHVPTGAPAGGKVRDVLNQSGALAVVSPNEIYGGVSSALYQTGVRKFFMSVDGWRDTVNNAILYDPRLIGTIKPDTDGLLNTPGNNTDRLQYPAPQILMSPPAPTSVTRGTNTGRLHAGRCYCKVTVSMPYACFTGLSKYLLNDGTIVQGGLTIQPFTTVVGTGANTRLRTMHFFDHINPAFQVTDGSSAPLKPMLDGTFVVPVTDYFVNDDGTYTCIFVYNMSHSTVGITDFGSLITLTLPYTDGTPIAVVDATCQYTWTTTCNQNPAFADVRIARRSRIPSGGYKYHATSLRAPNVNDNGIVVFKNDPIFADNTPVLLGYLAADNYTDAFMEVPVGTVTACLTQIQQSMPTLPYCDVIWFILTAYFDLINGTQAVGGTQAPLPARRGTDIASVASTELIALLNVPALRPNRKAWGTNNETAYQGIMERILFDITLTPNLFIWMYDFMKRNEIPVLMDAIFSHLILPNNGFLPLPAAAPGAVPAPVIFSYRLVNPDEDLKITKSNTIVPAVIPSSTSKIDTPRKDKNPVIPNSDSLKI